VGTTTRTPRRDSGAAALVEDEALLTPYPDGEPGRRRVYAAVDLGDEFHQLDTEDLQALALGLEARAVKLREPGEQLAHAREQTGPA
jgi:hypothetical protein